MSVVLDFILDFFSEIIFQKILVPIFKIIGALFRWIFLFRSYSLVEVYSKDNNGLYGFIIFVILVVIIVFDNIS